MLTNDDIKILGAKFDEKTISIKIQSLNKAKDKAMLVLYLQHTDVYSRLEMVDPAWSCETVDLDKSTNDHGTIFFCRMRMTVKGVSRENVGDGNDPKSAYSDALKRCAMLFGVGRYLYDTETVWVPYNEANDRYKIWTMADYRKAWEGRK